MSTQHFTYYFIISFLLLFAGCSKNISPTNAAQAASSLVWNIESINNLLPFAPQNTPFIMASTHGFEHHNGISENIAKPVLNAILTEFPEINTKINNSLNTNYNTDNDNSAQILHQIILAQFNNYLHLIQNYPQEAHKWGLHPNGHHDYIFYISNDIPTLKFTAENAQTLKSYLNSHGIISNLANSKPFNKFISIKEYEINGELWTIYDLTKIICHEQDSNSDFEPLCRQAPDIHHYAAAIAIHYGNDNIVTTAFMMDNHDAILPELLKTAEAPVTPAMLPSVTKDIHHFTIIKTSPLNDLIHRKLTQILRPEAFQKDYITNVVTPFKTLATQYHSIEFQTRMNNNQIILDTNFKAADLEQLTNLKDVTTGTRPFSNNIQTGIQISANLHKIYSIFSQRAEKYFGKRQNINNLSIKFSLIKSYIKLIDAVNIEIKHFFPGNDNIEFDGKISLYGKNIHSIVQKAYGMMGNDQMPELNTPRPMQIIDTSEMFSAPLNEVLKESEYSTASSSYDLNEASPVTNSNTMIHLIVKTPILKTIQSRYHVLNPSQKLCQTMNFSEETCTAVPSRLLELFDDNAGFELKYGSNETAETLQMQYNFSLKQ